MSTIRGVAWAGESDVVKLEVAIVQNGSWKEAQLGPKTKYAWRQWQVQLPLPKGEHEIVCRATDSAGRTQPEFAKWNPSGYLWNGWDRVKVTVG